MSLQYEYLINTQVLSPGNQMISARVSWGHFKPKHPYSISAMHLDFLSFFSCPWSLMPIRCHHQGGFLRFTSPGVGSKCVQCCFKSYPNTYFFFSLPSKPSSILAIFSAHIFEEILMREYKLCFLGWIYCLSQTGVKMKYLSFHPYRVSGAVLDVFSFIAWCGFPAFSRHLIFFPPTSYFLSTARLNS